VLFVRTRAFNKLRADADIKAFNKDARRVKTMDETRPSRAAT
jgi:hypothetical protein